MVRLHIALHNEGITQMTVNQIGSFVDRMGLGLINALVVIGLPLVAIGLFIQPL